MRPHIWPAGLPCIERILPVTVANADWRRAARSAASAARRQLLPVLCATYRLAPCIPLFSPSSIGTSIARSGAANVAMVSLPFLSAANRAGPCSEVEPACY
ncbi:hypothetical protein KCP78_08280 [Salmonella enterica subsp. enterica]|nr:hypothetical protein KCP78_08280 [Salmonella enterica subsp. enterica]